MLRLSQGQLNLLETCPRKFQHVYLDQLGSPPTPEQQERMTWGTRFHLLMQQRELGLPIASFDTEDQALQHCIEAFVSASPDVFQQEASSFRQSEHRRTLEFQGYLLTVIYDLLVLSQQQAQILDWKTYARPQKSEWLKRHWQTRLYLFVLAETGGYAPEQISMSYWFVQWQQQPDPSPQQFRFNYSKEQWQRDRHDLIRLLNQLTEWMGHYHSGTPFPQVSHTSKHCETCQFATRCNRSQFLTREPASLSDVAEIQEISL